MSKIKKNKKHVLRAVIVSLFAVLVLAAAFAANVSAADGDVEYVTLNDEALNNRGRLENQDVIYRLENDFFPKESIVIPSDMTITIDLNGYVIDGRNIDPYKENNSREGTIINNTGTGTLIIKDSRPDSEAKYFRKTENGPWEWVQNPTEEEKKILVAVNGGIITGGRNLTLESSGSNGGGAIRMSAASKDSKTYFYGGTLIGNSSTRAGGAVYGGAFYMYGGTIKGNYGNLWGGGVSVSGAFEMSGGIIEDNSTNPNSSYNINPENAGDFYDNPEVVIGFNSSFNMSGGSIRGNISTVTNTSTSEGPTFNISGGEIYGNFRLLNKLTATFSGGTLNGSVYMYEYGTCYVQGNALITNGKAENGGAVWIRCGSFTMTGGTIENCEAEDSGGAIYVGIGEVTISGGVIKDCKASNLGGAIYVGAGSIILRDKKTVFTGNGSVDMSNGTIRNCDAQNGGAVYVAGGNFTMTGGAIDGNEAKGNGGAVYVNNGDVTMKGGSISGNEAIDGRGGAFFVSSDEQEVRVTVTSGEIIANKAKGSGGAIAVAGTADKPVTVTIGIHELHEPDNSACDHDAVLGYDMACPQIKNNTTNGEGGAIHISGTEITHLNIYCLTEEGNRGGGLPAGDEKTTLSDFLKVDGGRVVISSEKEDSEEAQDLNYGKSDISGSVYVTGGKVDIYGAMENPIFRSPITVDIQKADDHYEDHRKNVGDDRENWYYNIHYFENFKVNGVESGQYTAYQVKHGDIHTVVGVIYSHSGYSISGWNTDKEAKLLEEGIWYYASDVLKFPDKTKDPFEEGYFPKGFDEEKVTLFLYAIWDENVYTIHFDSNAPYGTPVSGSMPDMAASCADKVTLIANQFVRSGYLFLGWSLNKNADVIDYNDAADIEEPLTTTAGDTITLYAVWTVCNHKAGNYTYSKEGDSKLICTCECTYYITMTIKGNPGVYDPSVTRPASIVFGASNPTDVGETKAFIHSNVKVGEQTLEDFVKSAIKYAKNAGDDSYIDLGDSAIPANAGRYKASLTFAEQEIFVIYEIDKAQQTPPVKPKFATDAESSKLTIEAIVLSSQTQNAANFIILYADSEGWKSMNVGAALEHTIDTGWTSYYVQAYYPGNENYYDSIVSSSDAEFYTGGVKVNVIVNAGLTYKFDTESGTAKIVIAPVDKYYVQNYTVNGNGLTFTVITKNNQKQSAKLQKLDQYTFELTDVSEVTDETITIVFSDAKLIPVVSSSVAPREEFGDFANTSTSIANDSAFTSYFTIKYYDNEEYADPGLLFNKTLPKGTTIIMVDKTSGATYWYVKLETAKNTVALLNFKGMGTNTEYTIPGLNGENMLKYQFIVDFSDANESLISDDLTLKLGATSNTYAPAFDSIANNGVNVELKAVDSPNIDLEKDDPGANLKDTVVVTLPQSEVIASKWENLNYSLVVIPENANALPPDAKLEVIETINGRVQTTTYPLSEIDTFIVSVNRNSRTVVFRLKSEIEMTGNYCFSVQLYAAYIDDAPINNIFLCEISTYDVELSLSAAKMPSAKIEGTQKVCIKGDNMISLTVRLDLAGYTDYDILLMREGENGYSNTAWRYEKNEMLPTPNDILNVDVSLGGQDKGNYCVMVIVKNSENTTILSVPYYFVIIE